MYVCVSVYVCVYVCARIVRVVLVPFCTQSHVYISAFPCTD
jgi:hypothetical protein